MPWQTLHHIVRSASDRWRRATSPTTVTVSCCKAVGHRVSQSRLDSSVALSRVDAATFRLSRSVAQGVVISSRMHRVSDESFSLTITNAKFNDAMGDFLLV